MNQVDYCEDVEVSNFQAWLVERLCGKSIDFSAPSSPSYVTLASAFDAYNWPSRSSTDLPKPDGGIAYIYPDLPALRARSSFEANALVLAELERALRNAYADRRGGAGELAGAVAAIFHWGGVYGRRGNRAWLAMNHGSLFAILQAVVEDYSNGSDESSIHELRFNSGMTKVYSLLIDSFIIYDSRVAAALTWLVKRWWTTDRGMPAREIPSVLKFPCLPANSKWAAQRNVDASIFPTISGRSHEHYKWNVRANWMFSNSLRTAGSKSMFGSVRELEAALFQMGARVI